MLNVRGIVLSEEFDLRRGASEAVVRLEGGKQHLADQPWHLAFLRALHRQHDSDRFGGDGMVVVERARPPSRGHLHAADRFVAQARSAAEPEYQLSVIVGLVSGLRNSL